MNSDILREKSWFVYLLECNDSSFYCGVTNDLDKRMNTHKSGKGSKYVKSKGFKQLLHFRKCNNRSEAQKAECYIKTLYKYDKINWFIKNK